MNFSKGKNSVIKNNKGYSLAEVIVAIAILGLLSAMFAQISFSSLKARSVSRERLEAVAIATSAIDEIKSFRGNSDSGVTWNSVSYLKGRLGTDNIASGPLGYTTDPGDATGNTFIKTYTDTNNIDYNVKLIINSDNGLNNTFDLTIIINSPNVTDWKAITRIRGE